MRVLYVLALCTASCVALAADGEGQIRPIDQLMAEVIEDLMIPEQYAHWAFSWDAIGTRSRDVRWHLSAPRDDASQRTTHQRTGWIGAGGEQIRVTVCGTADRVTTITFNDNGHFGNPEARPGGMLLDSLGANGIAVNELHRNQTIADYDLRPEGRVPARLRVYEGCTSPMARSAQRCWTDYTVVLDIDASDETMAAAQMCGGREDMR